MKIHNSYFSVANPVRILDRWLHPYHHQVRVILRDKYILTKWTRRAERAFSERNMPLIAEMQLYFTCVVKKRVLFHDETELTTEPVNERLSITFRAVDSTSCDPEKFAQNYPIRRELESHATMKLSPSLLLIDFRRGKWIGDFNI